MNLALVEILAPSLTPVSDINVASASFVSTTGADYFDAQGVGLAGDIQPGMCRTATWAYDLATLLWLRQPVFLDAGLGLQLDAPNGRFAMTAPTGQYTYTSTGPFPVGKYKISGSGGRNVGPFSIDAIVPEPLNWTNSNISTVSRDRDLTITWAGGKTDGLITITGITIADTLGLFGGALVVSSPRPMESSPSRPAAKWRAGGNLLQNAIAGGC